MALAKDTAQTSDPSQDASSRALWTEAAFDALEFAAALFDARFRLQTVNAAWKQRFAGADGSCDLAPGASAADVMRGLTLGSGPRRVVGYSGEDLSGLLRACVRDYELPCAGSDPLLLTSTPTSTGSFVVMVRQTDRGRILEERALHLLRESVEAIDVGLAVWDAGLIVRVVNNAFAHHLVPVRVGDPVEAMGRRLIERGVVRHARGDNAEGTFTEWIIEAHRHPRRWEAVHADGRRTRMATFPTQSGGVLALAFDVTERNRVELRARWLLSDAIESLGDGVLLLNAKLESLLYNRAFVEVVLDGENPPPLGVSARELMKSSIEMGRMKVPDGTEPADAIAAFEDEIVACRSGVLAEHAGGRYVERTTYPTAMGGYVTIFRDVTERRVAERQLRKSEQRTRTIVETLREGVALYNADHRLELNNAAFRRLMFRDLPLSAPGMHVQEEIRNTIAAGTLPMPPGMPDDDPDVIEAAVLRAIDEEHGDMEVIRSGGEVLEASMSRTADGGFLTVLRDVTVRKRAEQAAREADDLVRTIVDSSPSTFLVTRYDDGAIVFAPPIFRERHGDVNECVSLYLSPSDRQSYLRDLDVTGSLSNYPVRFLRSDGSVMDGLLSAKIIDFRGEKLIVSSTQDITDQIAMRAELERQRELAHQNEKLSALGGLLAGVAHELNNPLSIVVANAMMLEEDVTDPVLQRRVQRLATAAKRSGRIVKTFLAMARNRPMRLELADMNEIVETAVEISAYGLRARGADVVLDLAACDTMVEVDADQIIQVLSNLIINAEHAMSALGSSARLTISTGCNGNNVVAEVRDNGPGVPRDLRTRIFEPYFTTKEVGEGTGVGLAFCHRVMSAHGGRVVLQDSPHEGAVFVVTLPRTRAAADRDVSDAPEEPAPPAHVLVLDDEEDVAETIADALSRADYRVRTVTSAAAALEACARERFDAVLSDVRMAYVDGLQFYEELQRRDLALSKRLAFITGDAMGHSKAGALARTGRPFLEKPVEPNDVLRLVSELIDGAHHER